MSDPREQDRLLEHNYDGIQEYDNPMPRWWVYLFWVTIVFSVLYMLNVPGIGTGKGRVADYEREMAAAAKAAPPPGSSTTPEQLAALAKNAQALADGRKTFTQNCVACHAMDGGGGIGPNLTDDYWLHGAAIGEIRTTVINGVLEKGMPPWGKVLAPAQLDAVVAYVSTLRGTKPAAPKAPQGTLVQP